MHKKCTVELIDSNGVRWKHSAAKAYHLGKSMHMFYRTEGVDTDVLLCPDPFSEELELYRRKLDRKLSGTGFRYSETDNSEYSDSIRLQLSMNYDGYVWKYTGNKLFHNGNLMYVFYRTAGIDNDVLLCPDPSIEELEVYRRTRVPGTESYSYEEVSGPVGPDPEPPQPEPNYFRISQYGEDALTLSFKETGPEQILFQLEYRLSADTDSDWNTYEEQNIVLEKGEYVEFRGNNNGGCWEDNSDYGRFYIDNGTAIISGEITSLFNGTGGEHTLPVNACRGMFYGCTGLVDAIDLVLPDTVSENCYREMFYGCTGLSSASKVPILPAIDLSGAPYCYASMFENCSNLDNTYSALTLPATVLSKGCYSKMLRGSGVTKAVELPATRMESECYAYMYQNCINLVSSCQLPATVLAPECYRAMFSGCVKLADTPDRIPAEVIPASAFRFMFQNCENIATGPEIGPEDMSIEVRFDNSIDSSGATGEACRGMFEKCKKLTKSPVLRPKILNNRCYRNMFDYCEKLSEITYLASEAPGQDFVRPDGSTVKETTNNWVRGVASTGLFKMNSISGYVPVFSDKAVPVGWEVMTQF